jgi:hypothetical protein
MLKLRILAMAVVGVLLCAVSAEGHVKHYDVKVKLTHVGPVKRGDVAAIGKVRSDNASCQRLRTVYITRKVDGPDVLAHTTTTTKGGTFGTAIADMDGRYYAEVERVKIATPGPGHRHVCDYAKSDIFKYP